MATIIEAYEAAKAGKLPQLRYRVAEIKNGTLYWVGFSEATPVEIDETTADGWNIEEPKPPEPEYNDLPVVVAAYGGRRTVEGYAWSCRLCEVEDEPNFAGYGYRWEDRLGGDVVLLRDKPFIFGDSPDTLLACAGKEGQIRWCDFVRFTR